MYSLRAAENGEASGLCPPQCVGSAELGLVVRDAVS